MTNWTTTPIDARILRGALEVERTARGVLARLQPAIETADQADI
ncbi:MAG: hypothetical protein JWN52_5099 [Actinomycetia bacterium]|jgi:hypothetical protein|nr:hypothetical protein [Actinomycetes bacterium]